MGLMCEPKGLALVAAKNLVALLIKALGKVKEGYVAYL